MLRGHTDRVNAVRWLGALLVTGASDGTVRVWDVAAHRCLATLGEAAGRGQPAVHVTAVGVHVDATGTGHVAACLTDERVRLWTCADVAGAADAWEAQEDVKGMWMTAAWASLPGTGEPLLALGGTQDTVALLHAGVCLCTLKGHEDWVRSIDIVADGDELLVASASQDKTIRLWRIATDRRVDAESGAAATGIAGHRVKGRSFTVAGVPFSVHLDSVLHGHEDIVYTAAWFGPRRLLTVSMDRTMMVWMPDDSQSGIWADVVRVGELGGRTLGFFGGAWAPDGMEIMAHGYHGAFHRYACTDAATMLDWVPRTVVSGHFDAVRDAHWDPHGDYFWTVSKDQTARVFARPLAHNGCYLEVARPQVHGFDMRCGAFVPRKRHCVVSGADEKILRVFEAPQSFIDRLRAVCGVAAEQESEARPLLANVPELGLSNKPGDTLEGARDTFGNAPPAQAMSEHLVTGVPYEEDLIQSTLWPEVQKLYGHGNEMLAVASTSDGGLLASACRAAQADHAFILLWSTTEWISVGRLDAFTLSVVALHFDPTDRYLLAVSRDRTLAVFDVADPKAPRLALKVEAAHARIIWSCTWTLAGDAFATGSRDKFVKIFRLDGLAASLKCPAPVTAVEFGQNNRLAVGMEDGSVHVLAWDGADGLQLQLALDADACPSATVTAVRWKGNATLLVASEDHSVRVIEDVVGS